jgi:hypothetical protein
MKHTHTSTQLPNPGSKEFVNVIHVEKIDLITCAVKQSGKIVKVSER